MPISTASAPASIDGAHDVAPLAPEPPGDVGDEQLVPGGPPFAQVRLERDVHAGAIAPVTSSHRGAAATWAASLSPRPDNVTRTVEPAGTERPASRASHPIACAGSSAGTMPSVAARS